MNENETTMPVLVFVSGTFFIGKPGFADGERITLKQPRIIMYISQGPNSLAIAMPELTGSPREITIRYDAWYECNNIAITNQYIQETTGLIMAGPTSITRKRL